MVAKKIKKDHVKKNPVDLVKCLWGLVCSGSAIDQEINNLTLFNVVDQINIPKTEFEKLNNKITRLNVTLPHEIVLVWRTMFSQELNEGINVKLKIKLVDANGIILGEHLVPMAIPAKKRRYRFRIRLMGIQVTTPGDYCYQIEVMQHSDGNFILAQEIPIEIVAVPVG